MIEKCLLIYINIESFDKFFRNGISFLLWTIVCSSCRLVWDNLARRPQIATPSRDDWEWREGFRAASSLTTSDIWRPLASNRTACPCSSHSTSWWTCERCARRRHASPDADTSPALWIFRPGSDRWTCCSRCLALLMRRIRGCWGCCWAS